MADVRQTPGEDEKKQCCAHREPVYRARNEGKVDRATGTVKDKLVK